MDDLWVVLPHLGAGGAQKVGLLAAAHFSTQGYRVKVLTLIHGHPVLHAIPKGVKHQELDSQSNLHPWLLDVWNRSWFARARRFGIAKCINAHRLLIRAQLVIMRPWLESRITPGCDDFTNLFFADRAASLGGARLRSLKALIEQERPQRLLSMLTRTNILCCLAAWDLPIHVVVSERNDPARQRLDRVWSLLRRLCYRRADVVTANTEGVLRALKAMGHWQRLELLPNPVPASLQASGQRLGLDLRQSEVLALARLQPQKGLDLLLRAFALLAPSSRTGWRLTLVGEGPEGTALKHLCAELEIDDVVFFEGFRSDTQTFLRRASIFALPSRFEGMPNALLEAMAFGLPSVVSDASPGPLEMVRDGVEGLVVPSENVEALSRALERLIQDQDLRERCGAKARTTLASLEWSVIEPRWRSVLAFPKEE
jgi:glycosyltransferase involved in cell wall biosynthesis